MVKIEQDLSYLKEHYEYVDFLPGKTISGVYNVRLKSGVSVLVQPFAFWDKIGPKMKLCDTKWAVTIYIGKWTFRQVIDMSQYQIPFWWAYDQRNGGSFYSGEDCHDIGDFIAGVWNSVYAANLKKHGYVIATALTGFTIL